MQMSSSSIAPIPSPSSQPNPNNINPPSSSSMKSPPSSLSLDILSLPPPSSNHNNHNRSTPQLHNHHNNNYHNHSPHVIVQEPIATANPTAEPSITVATAPLARVRLSDIMPYDGASGIEYSRSVEVLSGSLMRHNAVVIELGSEDSALMRCGLESTRLYFKIRDGNSGGGPWGKPASRGVYMYRAGR